jgi:hypothetical protein
MTIHYHGTPITPHTAFYQLAGKHFCVSFARPDNVKIAHDLGQTVMLDNGAFSVWRRGATSDWPGFYAWCDKWLDYPTTWAVIPDVITGTAEDQDKLLDQWPFGQRGAPVWHMHEPIDRLLRLLQKFARVCIGSSAQYAIVLSDAWQRRMDEVWNAIARVFRRSPWVHMLRGMACVGRRWPFGSADSTDVARNHNRDGNVAWEMSDRWDAIQCPPIWKPLLQSPTTQEDMFA